MMENDDENDAIPPFGTDYNYRTRKIEKVEINLAI